MYRAAKAEDRLQFGLVEPGAESGVRWIVRQLAAD
jgi:hypothetical protein